MQQKELLILAIILISGLLCFGLGFAMGYNEGVVHAVEFGLKISKHFVSVEFDETKVAQAILLYENQINTCYPSEMQNALIRNDSGN